MGMKGAGDRGGQTDRGTPLLEVPLIPVSSASLRSYLLPRGNAIYEEEGTWARYSRPLLPFDLPPSRIDRARRRHPPEPPRSACPRFRAAATRATCSLINGPHGRGRTPAHRVPRAPAQLQPLGMLRAAPLCRSPRQASRTPLQLLRKMRSPFSRAHLLLTD